MISVKRATISQGGQVQVPAEVRRRWETREVLIEDRGTSIVLRPLPDDPIGAALATLIGTGPSANEIRRQSREEDAEKEDGARQT
jgi:bifunctional DNA-binding transcriptional regulator/antitoxin component of YhaV-PrlF toxin-antitoxin module